MSELRVAPAPSGSTFTAGDMVAIETQTGATVVSLARGAVVGNIAGAPLAVSRAGYVLAVEPGERFGIARGPARWILPR